MGRGHRVEQGDDTDRPHGYMVTREENLAMYPSFTVLAGRESHSHSMILSSAWEAECLQNASGSGMGPDFSIFSKLVLLVHGPHFEEQGFSGPTHLLNNPWIIHGSLPPPLTTGRFDLFSLCTCCLLIQALQRCFTFCLYVLCASL